MQEIRNHFYQPNGRYALKFLDAEGNPELSLTKQSDKAQTDIHAIINRYNKTGLIDHVAKGVAMYGDYTNVNEYQEALNRTIKAQQSFEGLPSKIRDRFDNDPGKFFEFATDPKNKDELIKLGLANPPIPDPQPLRVEVVQPVNPAQ